MLDIEYLKSLKRDHSVSILYANASYMTYTPLEDENELDKLSNNYQLCLSASLIFKTGELDHFCISILDKTYRKKYSIYFNDNDDKKVYVLLNLPKVWYSDLVSLLKTSAKLCANTANKYCCTANLIIDKNGDNYLFNNGSGKGKPRGFGRVMHDTAKDFEKKRFHSLNGPELV